MKKILLSLLMVLGLFSMANAGEVKFDFKNEAYGLERGSTENQNVPYLESGATCVNGDVTLTFTDNGNGFRLWTDGLRIYASKDAKFNVSANGKKITKVVLTTDGGGTFDAYVNGTKDETGYTASSKTWVGSATDVAFLYTTKSRKALVTVTVTYEDEGGGGTDPDPEPEVTTYNGIADFFAAKPANESVLAGPLTAIYQNGRYLYITDTKGAFGLVYNSSDIATDNYVNGDQIASINGTYKDQNGLPQVIPTAFGAKSAGTAVQPETPTIDELTAASLGQYIRLTNVSIAEGSRANNYVLTDEDNNTITLYNPFSNSTYYTVVEVPLGDGFDVEGFVGTYSGTLQITPIAITGGVVKVPAETPVFSHASGMVAAGETVTLTTASEGASIYYTVDGSTPSAASTLYTSPLSITDDVVIKAIAIKADMFDSEVATAIYYTPRKGEQTATFDFTDISTLTPSYDPAEAPNTDNSNKYYDITAAPLGSNGVIFLADYTNQNDTGTSPRLYVRSSDQQLRLYKKSQMTVSVPDGYRLEEVKVTYNNTTFIPVAGDETTVDDTDAKTSTWTAGDNNVNALTFAIAADGSNAQVNTIEVKYAEIVAAPAEVTLTIEQPQHGTVTVAKGTAALENGAKVLPGTELTLSCTADEGYKFGTFTLNDAAINGNTFEAPAENFKVSAVIESLYCEPTSTTTNSGRAVTSIDVNGTTIEGVAASYGRKIYVDRLSSVIEVQAGDELTITSSGVGSWMHTMVYGDFDRNGWNVDMDLHTPNGDLLWYNLLCEGTSQTKNEAYYDMEGNYYAQDNNGNGHSVDGIVSTITIPADLASGDYRMRYKSDWGSPDPCGNDNTGKYAGQNSIATNGGTIIDFTLRVTATAPATYTMTVKPADHAKITVKNGEEVVESGAKFEAGTVLTLSAEVEEGYKLDHFMLNDDTLEGNTVTVPEADFTISAAVSEKPAEGNENFRFYSTDDSERYLTEFTYSVNGVDKVLYTTTDPTAEPYYVESTRGEWAVKGAHIDLTDKVIEIPANTEKFSMTLKSDASNCSSKWNQCAIVVDWNNNGEYVNDNESTGVLDITMKPNNAVVSEEGQTAEVVVPAKVTPGTYSLLVLTMEPYQVYDGIDPIDMWGQGWDWTYTVFNKGVCSLVNGHAYEFTVKVDENSAIDSIEGEVNDAAAEYYNLQGVRVAADNLTPGIYVRRQGNKVDKVLVK